MMAYDDAKTWADNLRLLRESYGDEDVLGGEPERTKAPTSDVEIPSDVEPLHSDLMEKATELTRNARNSESHVAAAEAHMKVAQAHNDSGDKDKARRHAEISKAHLTLARAIRWASE